MYVFGGFQGVVFSDILSFTPGIKCNSHPVLCEVNFKKYKQ